ncbi:hypothetical protein [Paenibacillus apiarius]|uniref:hypothetical protein n=1 Tax=Paenibacillus apiarius TaxID=46240 RepID=UPI0019817570|nr:hypothetical protein [Paenibacillus apiarius]MBN3524655.1 hypothetical protein [Paenibacillus apiarius]
MNQEIKALHDLEYGHVLMPSELINNAKLPNYEYVKFSSSPKGLVAECMCVLEDETRAIFNYYFDDKDRLMKLTAVQGTNVETLFDRKDEISKLRMQLCSLDKTPQTTG